jgi:hypothetical protein
MRTKIFDSKRNLTGILLMLMFCTTSVYGQGQGVCQVDFTSPGVTNMRLGASLPVTGTATIPAGQHLWLLVHRTRGYSTVWWPQGEAEIDPVTHRWELLVSFGGSQDIGYEFEIAAIVVNQQESARLTAYYQNAMTTGQWRPMTLPATVCPPRIVQVTKVSND